MSTVNVNSIRNLSSVTDNITLGSDGSVSIGGGNISPSTGMRNRIINGGMTIDQRNAGASVTPTDGQYTLDRWRSLQAVASKYSVQQSSTAPAGFGKSLLATSLSAYSVGASEYFVVEQLIEGFNFADLSWGTASAQPVTLSFWVQSSLTGTFGGAFRNSAANRSYPFTYTISSANTWEYKTLTVLGDTTGTWIGATNGVGVEVKFGLGVGSTLSGTAGAWAGANYLSVTGATSVVGTNGATLYITGVQLEKGSTATPFEFRDYGRELILCQRYFQKYASTNGMIIRSPGTLTGEIYFWIPFAVVMRVAPTMSVGTPIYYNANNADWRNIGRDGAEAYLNVTGSLGYAFVPWTSSAEL